MNDDKTLIDSHMEESWENLGKLTGISNPLFDRTFFLMGYDFSSNIYLLQGDYCSLVDPGNDYTAFMQLLDMGIKPPDIKKIALTHGHHDHAMGAVEMVRGYPGYAASLDVEIFLHEAGPVELKEMYKHLGFRITELKGGETINLSGLDLEVIHTPGHTIDGLCFYHAPTKTLFSGDTVMPLAMAEPDDKAAGGNIDHYLYSVRTLLKKDVDHVLPGHGGVAPKIGRWVVEETYDGLINRLLGYEPLPLVEGARLLAEKGLLEECLFHINKGLAKVGEDLEALEFKALVLNDLGRAQEALEVFDRVMAQKPGQMQVLLGKGCTLMGLGRYEESLSLFNEALQRQPQSPEAQIYKGMALHLAGRIEEAMELPAFRQEFASRLKSELEKLSQEKPAEKGA